MATKVLVNYPGSLSAEVLAAKRQSVADQLGVCAGDVILLPGLSVSVVELPDQLTRARAKADGEEARAAGAAADAQAAKELEAARPPEPPPAAAEDESGVRARARSR